MTRSMTGFASHEGAIEGWRWTWELRSVNGRGLDIRLRLPDTIDGIETPLRAALQARVGRGNVSVSLRLQRDETTGAAGLNAPALDAALALIARAEEAALEQDLELRATTAVEVLGMRGVLETGSAEIDPGPLRAALLADIDPLIDAFDEMRAAEGAALEAVIAAQVDDVETAVEAARDMAPERTAHMAAALQDALARISASADGIDPERVAQELAVIAVKTDVTEEIDRLVAHVAAARKLLAGEGPKGRKLDFLTQEFNREANTLASKAQYAALTRVGLDLKHAIDQMREQVQNVE